MTHSASIPWLMRCSAAAWALIARSSDTVIELTDPCGTWNYPPEQPVYIHVGAHDPCRTPSAHTESKARAATRSAVVPGGLLVAAMLAVAGAALSRRRVMIAAGIGMLAETPVVFSIAPLTLVVGVGFLLLSRRVQARSQ